MMICGFFFLVLFPEYCNLSGRRAILNTNDMMGRGRLCFLTGQLRRNGERN